MMYDQINVTQSTIQMHVPVHGSLWICQQAKRFDTKTNKKCVELGHACKSSEPNDTIMRRKSLLTTKYQYGSRCLIAPN